MAKKRALKKARVEAAKQDVRKKMSVIAATSINNDEELMLDSKTWDKLKALDDAEDVQKYLPKNMPESEAVSRKKTNTRTAPQIPPNSGRIRDLRKPDISLTRSSSFGGTEASDILVPFSRE